LPAQIAPFVVKRIGLTQARRLALLGSRFNGETAQKLGVVHDVVHDENELEQLLSDTFNKSNVLHHWLLAILKLYYIELSMNL
jgi:enoyl-CoA hydratase/carnithine racemase